MVTFFTEIHHDTSLQPCFDAFQYNSVSMSGVLFWVGTGPACVGVVNAAYGHRANYGTSITIFVVPGNSGFAVLRLV